MRHTRLLILCALALTAALFTGCNSVRTTTLGWSNSTMTGNAAPALDQGTWVVAEGWQAAREPSVDWKMLVVFQPS